MVPYLAKRIGCSILTLFIIVTLVFCLLRLMPVEGYFANYEKMTEAQIQAGLQSMGLLDPLPVQIGHFWRACLCQEKRKHKAYEGRSRRARNFLSVR